MFRGTSIGQLIPIIAFPILSRVYTPTIIGGYAIVFALATILGGVAGMRLEVALVTAEPEDRSKLLSLIFKVMWIVSIPLLAITYWVGTLFDFVTLDVSLEVLFFLLSLGLLNVTFNTLQFYNTTFENFKKNSNSRILLAGGSVAFQIIGGALFGASVATLFMGRVVALVLASLLLSRGLDLISLLKKESYQTISIIKKYSHYIAYYWPASFIDMLAFHLPVFLIGSFFNPALVGQYSFAYRGVSIPTATVGQAISQVFFKRFSDNLKKEGDPYKTLLGTWSVLFALGVIPFMGLYLFGTTVVPVRLGENWVQAGEIASIISPMAFLMFISTPTSTAILALGGQKLTLPFSIAQLLYKSGSLYYGYLQGDLMLGLQFFTLFHSIQIIVYNLTILLLMTRKVSHADSDNSQLVSK